MNSLKTAILVLLVFLSGCASNNEFCKPDASYYYLNPDRNLTTIGRAALVELGNDSDYPHISTDTTEALFQALQKKQLFSLAIVRQSNPDWKSLQIDSCQMTPTLEQLAAIRNTLKCDAVLIGNITGYKPFPHMAIGLRLKLIDLTDGQLLWALEQIWDTTDKKTEERIRHYYSNGNLIGPDTLKKNLGTISSLKFIKFVAFETAETLEPLK